MSPVATPPRILVVEDEALIAEDLRERLEQSGYEVCDTPPTGEEALLAVERYRPDLVLMDVRLQGALDGIETARRIRLRHDLPVVFLTAYSDAETVSRIEQSEAYGYVLKPFQERQLRASLELARRRHAAAGRLLADRSAWRGILDALPLGVVQGDAAGRVVAVNTTAAAICGWSEAEAAGRPVHEVLPLRPQVQPRPGGPLAGRLSLVRKDGVEVAVEAWFASTEGGGEAPIAVLRPLAPTAAEAAAARAAYTERLGGLAARSHAPGYVTVCSWTKEVSFDRQQWMSLERFFAETLGLIVTHGISPDGMRRFFPDLTT